jgi:hypothetical protein
MKHKVKVSVANESPMRIKLKNLKLVLRMKIQHLMSCQSK